MDSECDPLLIKKGFVLSFTCQVLADSCQLSCVNVMYWVSPINCLISLTPTATATDPPPANLRGSNKKKWGESIKKRKFILFFFFGRSSFYFGTRGGVLVYVGEKRLIDMKHSFQGTSKF